MAKKRILFVNQEIVPYVPKSDMADLGRDLPQKMQSGGFDVRTFMPKWGNINERRGQLHEVIRLSGLNIVIDDTDHPLIIKVASVPVSRLQVYFIDNEDYFIKRRTMTEDENGDEFHCQGWMAGVIPLYVKTAYHDDPTFANSKVVFSLFSKQFKSNFGTKFKDCVDFGSAKASLLEKYSEHFDFTDLARLAIDYSDGVIEATPEVNDKLLSYAESSNLPILKYPGENYAPAYKEFYNQLLG